MSYKYEIKDLKKELMEVKTIHLNTDDALTKHRMKHDIELMEYQIELLKQAAKAGEYKVKANLWKLNKERLDECEAKAKAWDEALERWNDIENDTEEFIHIDNDPDLYYNDFRRVLKKYESGGYHD